MGRYPPESPGLEEGTSILLAPLVDRAGQSGEVVTNKGGEDLLGVSVAFELGGRLLQYLLAAFQLGGQLVSLFAKMFRLLQYLLNLSPIIVR